MLTPLPPQDWNYETAAHLLNRAAFGGTPEEIQKTQAKGMTAAVRDLLRTDASVDVAPPEWAHPQNIREIRMEVRALKDEPEEFLKKKRALRKAENEKLLDLRHWWLERMMTTPAPLLEKMTLFWHGHFATSMQKVNDGYWMWRQNQLLRENALGNFAVLTKKVSRDPAMMIYLDLRQSQVEHPNENWARELMELFTVGIGNYTEQDVRESARAFTGYRIDPSDQQFRFVPRQHDATTKTFLGHAGRLDGDDVIDALVAKPACATFIGRKIWRYFVEDDPSPEIIAAVADRMRAHDFEMRPLLREIFSSAEFYSPRVRLTQIKGPVQFLIQTSKLLQTPVPAPLVAQNAMRQMGQLLFEPPNVKGWDGGKAWISTSTLLFRYNLANYLINGNAMLPAAAVAKQKETDPDLQRAPRLVRGNATSAGRCFQNNSGRLARETSRPGRAVESSTVPGGRTAKRTRHLCPISASAPARYGRRDHARFAASDDEHSAVPTLLRALR